MKKLFLRFILLFNAFWKQLGIDPYQLEAILETKIAMDSRRASLFNTSARGTKKELKNQDWVNIGIFLFMGLMFMTFLITFEDKVTALMLYFTAWLVLLAFTLISDFTEVLIDIRDNYTILPQPVNDRTLTAARIFHIGIYLSSLVVAFMLPASCYATIEYGFLGLMVFLLQMLISVIFVIFVVNLLYLLILRVTSPQRFKEVINYFQIAFIILLFTGYYLVPKLIDFEAFATYRILDYPITYGIPSTWIASLWDLGVNGDTRALTVVLSGLAIIIPLICIFLVTNVLAKNFSKKMLALNEGNTDVDKKVQTGRREWMNWPLFLSKKITRTPVEETGFKLTSMMTSRSRDYKLRVYPGFAFVPILFIYFAINGEGSLSERFLKLANDNYSLLIIYFSLFTLVTPLLSIFFSEKYQASWIYYALPIDNPGELLVGAIKAVLSKFFLPFYLLITIGGVLFWGPAIIVDFILGFFNIQLLSSLMVYFNFRQLPFADSWANQNKGASIRTNILTMVFGGILGGIHYLIHDMPVVMLSLSVISALSVGLVFRNYRRLSWEEMKIQ